VILVGLVTTLWSGTVHAHTDFDYSLPTDGASVGTPVEQITVAFTDPVTLVGNGFTVLDPQNQVLEPFAVTDDDTVFRLQFDPPLAGGPVGVKYEVRAADGHVLTGNFVFTVDAPVPTTPVTAPPTTVPPVTTTVATTDSTAPAAVAAPPTAPSVTPEPTADEEVAAAAPTTVPEAGAPADDIDDSGSGSQNGLIIAIAVAVALGGVGFLLIRSRTSSTT
jgi:methionine-rich copper-binding protein CopC